MIANTCANICVLLFSHNRYPHQKLCRYHLSFVSDAKSQSPVLLPILTVNIGNHEISLSGTVLMYASYISFKKAEAFAPDRRQEKQHMQTHIAIPKLSAPLQKNKATDPPCMYFVYFCRLLCSYKRHLHKTCGCLDRYPLLLNQLCFHMCQPDRRKNQNCYNHKNRYHSFAN